MSRIAWPSIKKILPFVLLLVICITCNIWVVTSANAFTYDDYTFIYNSQFHTPSEYFSILPAKIYNDRPMGALIIDILYKVFGFNYQWHHAVYLLFHIVNTFLVYALAKKLFNRAGYGHLKWAPFLAAAIFTAWPKSIMAVQWDSAIFDLFSGMMVLSILNLYLDIKTGKRFRIFNSFLIILLYYIALRTKEITIVVPVLILLVELAIFIFARLNRKEVARLRPHATFYILGIMMVVFFVLIFSKSAGGTIDPNNPYYLSYSPRSILTNLGRYVSLYYDYTSFDFIFGKFNPAVILPVAIMLAGMLAYAFYTAIKRKNTLPLFLWVSVVVAITPVLIMKNMQHVLYLYIPSIFISMATAVTINVFVNRISKAISKDKANVKPHLITWVNVIGALALLLLLAVPSVQNFRNNWCTVTQKDLSSRNVLAKLPKPETGSTVYVINAPQEAYTVFFYGPGYITNIVMNDASLKTIVNPEKIDASGPYVIWDYNNGDIKKVD